MKDEQPSPQEMWAFVGMMVATFAAVLCAGCAWMVHPVAPGAACVLALAAAAAVRCGVKEWRSWGKGGEG